MLQVQVCFSCVVVLLLANDLQHNEIANILEKVKLHETGQYGKINKRIHITGRSILTQRS